MDKSFAPPQASEGIGRVTMVPASAAAPKKKKSTAHGPQTWTVLLRKRETERDFGLDLDIDNKDRLSVLNEPQSGAALAWNESDNKRRFRPGDIVEAVNGVSEGARSLLQKIKQSSVVLLSLTRLVDYAAIVVVQKGLGLTIMHSSSHAIVTSIAKTSDVSTYNRNCLAGYRVTEGDWLVSVDGKSGDARDLALMLDERGQTKVK